MIGMAITFGRNRLYGQVQNESKVEQFETLDVRPTTAELDTLFDALDVWLGGERIGVVRKFEPRMQTSTYDLLVAA